MSDDLLEMMDPQLRGRPTIAWLYDKRVQSAVAEVVCKQVECGLDIVTDGEQGKAALNIVWAKFETFAEGAAIGTKKLWRHT